MEEIKAKNLISVHSGNGNIAEGFDNMKYVHQFQNLVFVLEAEELNLNYL